MTGIKESLYGVSFIVAKLVMWVRNCPCLNCWSYTVQIEQAGHKGKTLLNFPIQGGIVLQNSCFTYTHTQSLSEILAYRPKMDTPTVSLGELQVFTLILESQAIFIIISTEILHKKAMGLLLLLLLLLFLRQGPIVLLWLFWNSLCKWGWQGSSCFCLWSAGVKAV